MLQPGQNLSLTLKPFENLIGVHAAFNQLHRHLLLELSFGSFGQIHSTHAAAADFADDFVGANVLPFQVKIRRKIHCVQSQAVEKAVCVGIGFQQGDDFFVELAIVCASLF